MTTSPGAPALLGKGSARVKEARKLSRRSVRAERRLFLADGPKAVEGALSIDGCVVEVFATPAAVEKYAVLAGRQVMLVDEAALASLSEAVHPAGVVAVCRFIDRPVDELIDGAGGAPIVVCADVRDPGNAGTIIRTADAAGAAGVILTGNSVDPCNDKTVRATVGSLFHIPFAIEPDTASVLGRLRDAGHRVLACEGAGEAGLYDPEVTGLLGSPVAWLLGNEAWGLPDEIAMLADHRVRIPMVGGAESLNLSTAAAICLYEGLRVRQNRTRPNP